MIAALKVPPHSMDAEVAVLGALLVDQKCAATIFGVLSPDDFYRFEHQTIAGVIHQLHSAGKPHDWVSVKETAGAAVGLGYIETLASECYTTASAAHHAGLVRDRANQRRIIALCSDAIQDAYTGSDTATLVEALSSGSETILKRSGSVSRKFAELLGPTEEWMREAASRYKAGGCLGVPTGLPALDKDIGGVYGRRLYGLAGRPASGKTALLNQIAVHAAMRGHPGLICSLEMGGEELMIRALAAHGKLPVGRLFGGRMLDAACETGTQMGDLPLWIDTDTYGLDGIIAQIAMHKQRHGIQWAAVDHVGLIETEKFNSRNDQIGQITRRLKQTCKRLGIPIVALLQLNRDSERDNREPGLHDLRDSGNIEQDLDVALFLHVKREDREKIPRPVELAVAKNRSGRIGKIGARFEFNGTYQRFVEIEGGYGQ